MKTTLLQHSDNKDTHKTLEKDIQAQLNGYDLVYRAPTTNDAKAMVENLMKNFWHLIPDENGEIIIKLNVFEIPGGGVALSIVHVMDNKFIGENALIKGFQFGYRDGGPVDLYNAIAENFDLADEEFLNIIKTGERQNAHPYLNINLLINEF